MGGYMAFAAAYVLVDLVSFAALSAVITGQGLLPAILSFLRFVVGIYLGLASVGVVLALTLQPRSLVSALLSGAILVALMLIMKHNFGLFLQVKSAYGRTVGVLARLAEFEREEARGHSERVADIATGVGRQLRIPNRDLERLNLAALLHAIGRVGSVQARPGRMAGHARLGARMASSIDFLAPIAEIIERHHCKPDEAQSSAEGRLAHIVGVACKFDQLVAGPTERIDEGLAWEYMRSRPAEFASDVIEALRLYRGL
jgi:putative nucleotidyltransferase with HDIG domain